jgi:hypothetical protein
MTSNAPVSARRYRPRAMREIGISWLVPLSCSSLGPEQRCCDLTDECCTTYPPPLRADTGCITTTLKARLDILRMRTSANLPGVSFAVQSMVTRNRPHAALCMELSICYAQIPAICCCAPDMIPLDLTSDALTTSASHVNLALTLHCSCHTYLGSSAANGGGGP